MSRHRSLLHDSIGRLSTPSVLIVLLLAGNLLNYLDRQLFLSLFPLIRVRFSLSDPMIGILASSFTLVYVISAPLAGYLIRNVSLATLLGSGILIFSAGMAISGLAPNLPALFAGRMLTGLGEATLTTLGPFFLLRSRSMGVGTRLGLFFSAIPLGSALGFGVGAYLPRYWDFQSVLLLPVIPGVLLGIWIWYGFRGEELARIEISLPAAAMKPFWKRIALAISFQTLVTFVLGGMAAWISLYLTRSKHFDLTDANMISGIALLTGGVSGMFLGGKFLDNERQKGHGGWGRLTTMTGFFLAATGIAGLLLGEGKTVIVASLVCAAFGLFLVTVPINWLILSWNSPLLAAPMMGWGLLASHALGDLPSPALIGWLSQRTSLDQALSFLLVVPVVSGILLAWGSRSMKIGLE
ncbi:MAG: MFS transporter [Leptospirales bacterium]